MKTITALVALLSVPAAAWADDDLLPAELTLDDPAPSAGPDEQETEGQPMRPDDSAPVMEYVYRNSEFDAGFLYTHWDSDLDLEEEIGGYARYGVGLLGGLSVHLSYRHYGSFENSESAAPDESVRIRALLGGIGYRLPITSEFAFVADGSVGIMRWETGLAGADDDTGFVFSGEGALTVRLHEVLRLKAGVVLDVASTEFHEDSTEAMLNLSWLVGFEIGI
jgi:hypothetical protein